MLRAVVNSHQSSPNFRKCSRVYQCWWVIYRKRADYCFESTVSKERPRSTLRQTRWVPRKQTGWVRCGTQCVWCLKPCSLKPSPKLGLPEGSDIEKIILPRKKTNIPPRTKEPFSLEMFILGLKFSFALENFNPGPLQSRALFFCG